MRFRLQYLILLLGCLTLREAAGITLSEIMFDPAGSESANEFVELYNDSAFPLDLSGWMISDEEDSDTIMAFGQGTLALPGQFVLILDPDYFEDSSTTYDGLVPDSALVVTIRNGTIGSRGLSNSTAETVFLLDPQGHVVSSYGYTIGNSDGHSDEKVILAGGDTLTNWSDSRSMNGTPGMRNSVTPRDRDLAVTHLSCTPSVPRIGDAFQLLIVVKNEGRLSVSDTLVLSEMSASDSGEATLLHAWPLPYLGYLDSMEYSHELIQQSSQSRIFVAELTAADEDSSNDRRWLSVNPAGTPRAVVVNEVMIQPTAGRSEWIELASTSNFPSSLSGWSFADGNGITDTSARTYLPNIVLPPEGFAVLAAESTVFFEPIPAAVPVVVWNSRPPSLNDNGDSLVVFDNSGQLIDRLDYRPSWSDGESGISLERISPYAATNDEANWLPSLDSAGSTPGRRNTRAGGSQLSGVTTLELSPNPFSPDGDGRDDALVIRCGSGSGNSRMTLKVFDVRGREIKRLATNQAFSQVIDIVWDGRDSRNRDAPTGIYVIYLEILSSEGEPTRHAKRAAALARRS